ncbi:MAG: lysophospholipid acyltransferase family protein [Planctomycetota bacterium]|jgi:1-acyl-sn-glycerol-3-phosphate acyltransferase
MLEKLWRILAQGFAFFVFSSSAFTVALVVVPLARWLPGDERARDLRVQRIIHHSFAWFVLLWRSTFLVDTHWEGKARLRTGQPYLVVANHPSLIDVVALIAAMPQADCVVKASLFDHFFWKGLIRGAGYIPNEGAEQVLTACAERLAAGRSVLLFPEGTRSPEGALHPFQRGVARIALRAGVNPLPVVIRSEPPGLMRGQSWYHVPDTRMQLRLKVGGPIDIAPYRQLPRPIAARRLTRAMRDAFLKKLGYGETGA